MGNGDFKKAIFKNMFGVIMYENLKAQFLSYNRTNRKLTNSEVALFADWVSTEIFRDQLNNLDDYNFWKKCKKIVGDDETLVSYFNSCKFVLDNSMLF